MDYTQIIYDALIATVKRHSEHMHTKSEDTKTYCSTFCKCYNDYLQEPWGAWFTQEVGTRILQHMSKKQRTLNVLEVGSGKASKTYRNLFGDVQTCQTYPDIDIEYVTIDKNPECVPTYVYDILETTQEFEVHSILQPTYFDVVIIDVEPHGKEQTIYSRIKHAIKDPALIIFKCIGHMDMYGSSLARTMLDTIYHEGKVEDALLLSYDEHVTILSMMFRDVYVAYGTSGYKGRINQLLLGLKAPQTELTAGTIRPVDLMCLMYGWDNVDMFHKLQTYVKFYMLTSEKHPEYKNDFFKEDTRTYLLIASTSPGDSITVAIFQETTDKTVYVIKYADDVNSTQSIHMKYYNGYQLDTAFYRSDRLEFLFSIAQKINGIRNNRQDNTHEYNTAEHKSTVDISVSTNSNQQIAVQY